MTLRREKRIPITAIAADRGHVYDALTTVRPYNPAFLITDALAAMKEGSGKGMVCIAPLQLVRAVCQSGTADFSYPRGVGSGGKGLKRKLFLRTLRSQ